MSQSNAAKKTRQAVTTNQKVLKRFVRGPIPSPTNAQQEIHIKMDETTPSTGSRPFTSPRPLGTSLENSRHGSRNGSPKVNLAPATGKVMIRLAQTIMQKLQNREAASKKPKIESANAMITSFSSQSSLLNSPKQYSTPFAGSTVVDNSNIQINLVINFPVASSESEEFHQKLYPEVHGAVGLDTIMDLEPHKFFDELDNEKTSFGEFYSKAHDVDYCHLGVGLYRPFANGRNPQERIKNMLIKQK
jgi:hypothetical protein